MVQALRRSSAASRTSAASVPASSADEISEDEDVLPDLCDEEALSDSDDEASEDEGDDAESAQPSSGCLSEVGNLDTNKQEVLYIKVMPVAIGDFVVVS
ncbi:hypothetical protein WJX77_005376 [Trebouxia sp. C0004]